VQHSVSNDAAVIETRTVDTAALTVGACL